jgi:hypothetical protein
MGRQRSASDLARKAKPFAEAPGYSEVSRHDMPEYVAGSFCEPWEREP